MKEDNIIHLFMSRKEITLKDGRIGKIIKIEETREDVPFRGFNSREILYIKGKAKKEVTLLIGGKEQTFNIDDLMKLIKTEENKMEWIEYNKDKEDELKEGKNYIFQEEYGNVGLTMFVKNHPFWKRVTAYMELPKPYKKPKSLKDRLDEAVEKYCYEFSDEEWEDADLQQFFISYNYVTKKFQVKNIAFYNVFCPYTFKEYFIAEKFIDSFTTDELMKIMKGEVK